MSAEDGDLRPAPAWARSTEHTRVGPLGPVDQAGEAIDRLLVAERIARYGWAFDERDRALLEDCFAEDGVWEGRIMGEERVGPFTGRAAIADFLTGFWPEQEDQRRHVMTNVIIGEIDATSATAHAYLILLGSSDAAMSPLTAGPYRFELARGGDGVWRMTLLAAGFDAPY